MAGFDAPFDFPLDGGVVYSPPKLRKNTQYVAEGLARLPEQFRGAPRITALVSIFLGQCQQLEDAMWNVWVNRMFQLLFAPNPNLTQDATYLIDPAGTQSDLLDTLGRIVGQTRDGFSNAQYAVLLAARIAANHSDGRRETLISILSLLAPGLTIYAKQYPPKTIVLSPLGAMALSPYYAMQRFLAPAAAAGDKLFLVWTQTDTNSTLEWNTVYGTPVDTLTKDPGSSYVTGTGGGVFAGVVPNP